MKHNAILIIIGILLLVGIISAQPTIGGIADITSNSVNVTINGVAGDGITWVLFGQASGGEWWTSSNYTATAGTAKVQIWGAPLLGGTTYYIEACDNTGCSAESSFTSLPITPLPATNYGAAYKNLTQSHFNLMLIAPVFFQGYFNITGSTVFFGLLFGVIVLGMWRRNRRVRLVSIVMIILSPMFMYASSGLMFGIALPIQQIGQSLLCAGLAGVLLSLIKK